MNRNHHTKNKPIIFKSARDGARIRTKWSDAIYWERGEKGQLQLCILLEHS